MCFKILGTKIYISFLFCITVLFFAIIDKNGYLFYVLTASLLHEIGHIIMLCFFKNAPNEINFLLGGIEFNTNNLLNSKNNILVSLSGPIVNILLFVVFYKININFSAINLLLGLFNLLPFCGLDGATILNEILANHGYSQKIISGITILFSVGLFLMSIFINDIDNKGSLIIISVYFFVFGILNYG